ncbi:unnamed protein product [Didymodactylos carnosus]|uniref:Uncharacterized protein n=1 Tax=Didymodactylos carnosus TaxID=1234261 RepID=A0A813W608_9BILA|nr:unnamed protein product [Didymodactylos carnosus]CAF3640552.1 unnamed protein product [Didymodactylos carnosus]
MAVGSLVHQTQRVTLSSSVNSPSKKWWTMLKYTLGRNKHSSVPSLLGTSTHQSASSPHDRAQLLNKYFCSVGTAVSSINPLAANSLPQPKIIMSEFRINVYEVYELLLRIDTGKATAPGTTNRMLKEGAPVMTPVLTYLFNESLHISKAFDKVSHDGLIVKLRSKGIPDEWDEPSTKSHPEIGSMFEYLEYLMNVIKETDGDNIEMAKRLRQDSELIRCGKTVLISFLCQKVLDDELATFSIHAGSKIRRIRMIRTSLSPYDYFQGNNIENSLTEEENDLIGLMEIPPDSAKQRAILENIYLPSLYYDSRIDRKAELIHVACKIECFHTRSGPEMTRNRGRLYRKA